MKGVDIFRVHSTRKKELKFSRRSGLLSALAACIWLLLINACDESVTPPPDDSSQKVVNRILFASNRETPNSQQVFSMNPDGSDIRRITYPMDSITFHYAIWSPDLTRMAVVWSYYDLRRQEFPRLAITDSIGNYLYSLVDYCNYSAPTWSPNGKRIAFSKPATSFGGVLDIYVVGVSGSSLAKVTHFPNSSTKYSSASVLDWIDDNLLLVRVQTDSVFQDSTGRWNYLSKGGIYEMDLQGALVETVLTDSPMVYYSARMSPNRMKIAYLYNDRNGHTGVAIADHDGTNNVVVAPELSYYRSEGWYSWLCWSPDGLQLSFSADRLRPYSPSIGEIYLVNNNGTGFRALVSDTVSFNLVTDWR